MRKQKISWSKVLRYGIPILLTVLWLIFIFSNSLRDGIESGNQSRAVYRFVNGIIQRLGFDFTVSEHFLRKMAHFSEFAILSWLYIGDLRAFAVISSKTELHSLMLRVLSAVPFCLLCAGIDEFLQHFSSGRAPQFTDMMIDTAGAATGAVLFCLILWLVRGISRRQLQKSASSSDRR